MSRDNMELLRWGDGTIRLSFWDVSRGEDRIFVLREDGLASLVSAIADDGSETLVAVNLVLALRRLAHEMEAL